MFPCRSQRPDSVEDAFASDFVTRVRRPFDYDEPFATDVLQNLDTDSTRAHSELLFGCFFEKKSVSRFQSRFPNATRDFFVFHGHAIQYHAAL